MQNNKRVTLKTIALQVGVSPVTVSKALNDRYDISREMKQRILAVANELGYTPNHLAKSLRVGCTETIGVIVSDISNPFFGSVISGIEKVLRDEEYHVLLCDANEDPQLEERALRVLLSRRVDGIIITPVEERNFPPSPSPSSEDKYAMRSFGSIY
jgi:LacI family transcriptional regulator